MKTPSLLVAALLALPALADEDKLSPALAVVGKTHFLFLHFPIAVLFLVGFVEVVLRKRIPEDRRKEFTGWLLVLAAVAAVVTVGTGLVNMANEDWHGHTQVMVVQHRTQGIVTAILTIAALAAHRMPKLRFAFLPLLAFAMIGVTFTGHQGGDLVHGEGFLLESFNKDKDKEKGDEPGGDKAVPSDGEDVAEDARQRFPEGKAVEKPEYARDIKPILDRSCVKCHGPEKRKSGLRLDKKRYAMKGGETALAIIPGDVEKSLLTKYITLPSDDDDVMPSKGKLLAQSEIQTLKNWVAQGAEWPDDDSSTK